MQAEDRTACVLDVEAITGAIARTPLNGLLLTLLRAVSESTDTANVRLP